MKLSVGDTVKITNASCLNGKYHVGDTAVIVEVCGIEDYDYKIRMKDDCYQLIYCGYVEKISPMTKL